MRAIKILTDKYKGKIFLGRLRYRLEDNIRIDLKEIVTNRRNWIDSPGIGIREPL